MRCIIVEDNDGMRQLLRQLLADYFDDCAEARSGEEGLRMYMEEPADLVIMDNILPGMDGIETTERLLQVNRDVHVIMVTDFDDIPFRQAAMRAGIRGFYGKANLMHLRSYVAFLHAAARPANRQDSGE
ncbi:MAG: response regulator transcription factor [Bacteroidota bacterium]|nr:response regulator transcription factor [Bacteroidota bacterium]